MAWLVNHKRTSCKIQAWKHMSHIHAIWCVRARVCVCMHTCVCVWVFFMFIGKEVGHIDFFGINLVNWGFLFPSCCLHPLQFNLRDFCYFSVLKHNLFLWADIMHPQLWNTYPSEKHMNQTTCVWIWSSELLVFVISWYQKTHSIAWLVAKHKGI